MSSQKNPHLSAIHQMLADFDIETQVKRISLETLDTYMSGNRQAFEYIQEWNSKLKNFQLRLAEAQNYYKKIQINVNSKVEITNELNNRLSKFSEDFWEAMKENEFSLQQMRKNYVNLVRETGTQSTQIRNIHKNIDLAEQKITKNQMVMDDQVLKITEKIEQINGVIIEKDSERIKEAEKILKKFSETKAEMDTKANHLKGLLIDISMYRDQKLQIQQQLKNLYEQIQKRVMKTQFSQIRRYIDTNLSNEQIRVDEQIESLKNALQQQIQTREQADSQTEADITQFKKETTQQFNKLHKQIDSNKKQEMDIYEKFKKQTQENFEIKEHQIELCNQYITNNRENINNNFDRGERLFKETAMLRQRIGEAESNIDSFNSLLNDIQKDSLQRDDEMRKMKVDTNQMGNISEQMGIFGQKLMLQEEGLSKNLQAHEKLVKQVSIIETNLAVEVTTNKKKHIDTNKLLIDNFKQIYSKVDKQFQKIYPLIQQRHKQSIQFTVKSLNEKLDSFKDEFEFLDQVSVEIKDFKQQFRTQIEQSEQINIDIKEKMDKMLSMFTKLKTDFFLRIQALSQDQNKSSIKIKQTSKNVEMISKYMSEVNEVIMITVATELIGAFLEAPIAERTGFKIASILEGWIIEAQEKDNKVKYRGQYSSRKMLLQTTLQYLVKLGDKIKGGFLENGKQVYNRITNGSEEIRPIRKKSATKRGRSELPKLYK